jgi:hypothetical protein
VPGNNPIPSPQLVPRYTTYVAHKLLGRKNQLVVYDPLGELLQQAARRVDVDRLLVLYRLVVSGPSQLRRMVEEA